jgi:hypothetical protein
VAKKLFPTWPTSSAFNPATWIKQVVDQAKRALERAAGRPLRTERLQAKLVERLQSKLVNKNEVIAELMQ